MKEAGGALGLRQRTLTLCWACRPCRRLVIDPEEDRQSSFGVPQYFLEPKTPREALRRSDYVEFLYF
jgi:hypothetical protein